MTISLATAWNPRGEVHRFQKLYPKLISEYSFIALSLPPFADPQVIQLLQKIVGDGLVVTDDWDHGRHACLEKALESDAQHIHYVDTDRMLRWVETRPEEWKRTLREVVRHDFLVIGRTEAAWATHPQALRQTEQISSGVISRLLGQSLDISAGAKGISRAAAEFIVSNLPPGRALGADSAWTVLARRGGFQIQSILVDGLDWEIADRYEESAASPERQRHLRDAYDTDPGNWAHRVRVAQEIVEAGLDAWAQGYA